MIGLMTALLKPPLARVWISIRLVWQRTGKRPELKHLKPHLVRIQVEGVIFVKGSITCFRATPAFLWGSTLIRPEPMMHDMASGVGLQRFLDPSVSPSLFSA